MEHVETSTIDSYFWYINSHLIITSSVFYDMLLSLYHVFFVVIAIKLYVRYVVCFQSEDKESCSDNTCQCPCYSALTYMYCKNQYDLDERYTKT